MKFCLYKAIHFKMFKYLESLLYDVIKFSDIIWLAIVIDTQSMGSSSFKISLRIPVLSINIRNSNLANQQTLLINFFIILINFEKNPHTNSPIYIVLRYIVHRYVSHIRLSFNSALRFIPRSCNT